MVITLTIIIYTAIISFVLFKKAAGTLAIGKLNIVSYTYYLFILQAFIGAILVNLGYRSHYTMSRLLLGNESIEIATVSICVTLIALPLTMLLVYRISKFNAQMGYSAFLKKPIEDTDNILVKVIITIIVIIQLVLLCIMIKEIGYLPLTKLFTSEASFDFSSERIRIQSLEIFGSVYIKNIIISLGISVIAYISFSYAIITKKKYWIIVSIVMGFSSIVVKTLDFSKSPLVFHLFVFLLIIIYYKKGIKNVVVLGFGFFMMLILILYYRVYAFSGSFLDIYNGILGRTLFTQFGTLCYHFDLFPYMFDFLNGKSLSPTILSLLGQDPEAHLRSAKIIMEFYGSESVYEGTAGVMNAAFIGEAYANFGIIGMLGSIVWVGIVISVIFIVLMRIKKTPVTIVLLAFFTQIIGNMTQGGFVDFIYSPTLIITTFGCLVLIYINEIYIKIKRIISFQK